MLMAVVVTILEHRQTGWFNKFTIVCKNTNFCQDELDTAHISPNTRPMIKNVFGQFGWKTNIFCDVSTKEVTRFYTSFKTPSLILSKLNINQR